MTREDIDHAADSADFKRTRQSGRSRARAAGRKRPIGPPGARAAAGLKRPLSDRIQCEREQLFKAIALVECCKHASASWAEAGAAEYIEEVFDVLGEMLDRAAGELGCVVEEYRGAAGSK